MRISDWSSDVCSSDLERLYAAAGTLPAEELARDRGAFFGSIVGTLNHLVVADTIWLQRFAKLPAPQAALDPVRALPAPGRLDDMPFPEFDALAEHRRWLDAIIERWMNGRAHDRNPGTNALTGCRHSLDKH